MPAQHIGPFKLAGVELETWLLKFDKAGACISPQTRAALLARLDAVPETPIILFSHGWNNEFGDAETLYTNFLTHFQQHLHSYSNGGLKPLFVGVIWPSTWLSLDEGPQIGGVGAGPETDEADEAFARELAERLPDPADRERLYELIGMPRLDGADASALAALVARALGAEPAAEMAETADDARPSAESVLAGATAVQKRTEAQAGASDTLGPGGTIGGVPAPGLQDAGLAGFLDPRKLLRVASVYQMKDRAGTVGSNGVAGLLGDMLTHSRAPLHVVGHSFGAKVLLSALAVRELPRKVTSALLLEPAISHLCFAAQLPDQGGAGGYRHVLDRIGRSILMTYSTHDHPLHEFFHLALRRAEDVGERPEPAPVEEATSAGPPPSKFAALGGYGPRRAGERLVEPVPEPGSPISIPAEVVPLAFDGTIGQRINSHGNVATPYTAWMLYSQMVR